MRIVIEIDQEMSHMKDTNSFCHKERGRWTDTEQTDRQRGTQTDQLTD